MSNVVILEEGTLADIQGGVLLTLVGIGLSLFAIGYKIGEDAAKNPSFK